jgi:hypothetical protein
MCGLGIIGTLKPASLHRKKIASGSDNFAAFRGRKG